VDHVPVLDEAGQIVDHLPLAAPVDGKCEVRVRRARRRQAHVIGEEIEPRTDVGAFRAIPQGIGLLETREVVHCCRP